MKIPAAFSKGLTEKQIESLERELKNSVLAKLLRAELQRRIELAYKEDETEARTLEDIFTNVGERRGYRQILNLIPEV